MATQILVDTTSAQTLTHKTLTAPAVTSGVLTACTAAADPTAPLGLATKQYVDDLVWSTGDVKTTLKNVSDTGWVLMNDGTIGNGSSGGTTRANTDTEDLFTLLWNNISDTWCQVSGGRGGSAASDFSANKTIRLPKAIGRALAGYGTGTTVESGVDAAVDTGTDAFTVLTNNTKWITGMSVVFTLASGTITGLTSGNTYYIIRGSTTTVQLASSLANAQNGTAINMTAKSSPVWTLTHTYTSRALGEYSGEEAHAMSVSELLAHTHQAVNGAAGPSLLNGAGWGVGPSGSAGGNAGMNIMQPTLFMNFMVKL